MDPVAKRIGRLRALLCGALTVTAVLYGLAVYFITSTAQQNYAGKEFKYLASQAGKDIRKSFAQSAKVCVLCVRVLHCPLSYVYCPL
jgi:hypothetical protein